MPYKKQKTASSSKKNTSNGLMTVWGLIDKSKNAILNQISIKYSCRIKKHLLFLLHE